MWNAEHWDVEVQYIFADAYFPVKRDRRSVAAIGLHVYHPRITFRGNFPQVLDQRCRNSPAPMALGDSQIVDIELAPCTLELVELVSHESPDNLPGRKSNQRDHIFFREQSRQIGIARRGAAVGFRIAERFTKDRIQRA